MNTIKPPGKPTASPPDISGKILCRRVQPSERATLSLTYTTSDAEKIRQLIQSLRIKGGRQPTMSLIARRSLDLYREHLQAAEGNPTLRAAELVELERLATRRPAQAKTSKRADR